MTDPLLCALLKSNVTSSADYQIDTGYQIDEELTQGNKPLCETLSRCVSRLMSPKGRKSMFFEYREYSQPHLGYWGKEIEMKVELMSVREAMKAIEAGTSGVREKMSLNSS